MKSHINLKRGVSKGSVIVLKRSWNFCEDEWHDLEYELISTGVISHGRAYKEGSGDYDSFRLGAGVNDAGFIWSHRDVHRT